MSSNYQNPNPTIQQLEKPTNWFTGLIIPSLRAIASGVGQVVSAIFSDSDSDEEDSVSAGEDCLLGDSPKSEDHGDSDQYNKALLEAKKWFEDKKVRSSSRTELVQSSFYTMSTVLQLGGSPVDVARSYTKDRPPWASPRKNIELRTPSTTPVKLLNEGMGSNGHGSLSLSKKRNSIASGSWNIEEELRRVRAKATEDMMRTPPSKIGISRAIFLPRVG